jgi:hypothetical protein
MASGYRPRIADAELRACLGSAGAVVCGSGYGYRRADGIAVLPAGALGP